jgi:hypothetical protein
VAKERVLTTRELNRALLARQLLLRRASLSVPRAIERLGALQAQWPPSPYVALWSRVQDFRGDDLMRNVERRRVVKATLMRTTLHLVTAHDYLAYAGIFLRRRTVESQARLAKYESDVDVDGLAAQLLAHTSEQPLSRPELLDLLGRPKLLVDDRMPWVAWHLLSAKAGLVHTPPSSVWRKHTTGNRFVPSTLWLGAAGGDGDAAAAHLVRRYLAAFGPATRADAAQWTGLPVSELAPALERIPLRSFRDEQGRVLLDLPRMPLPPAETEAPVRFLPMWDSSLIAHDDRSRILAEPFRNTVIRRNGDILQAFLVDGFVAGTWSAEDGRIALEPFEPLPRRARRELEDEARRLAVFVASN